MLRFRSNGKLLLTGEYLVLLGAKALAVPTKFGQTLEVSPVASAEDPQLHWISFDDQKQPWFNGTFSLKDFSILSCDDDAIGKRLQQMLSSCRALNPAFLVQEQSVKATSHLEFPRNWGLGSSSTVTNNLAQWANVDAMKLHFSISKGSGYDVAAAAYDHPIMYRLVDGNAEITAMEFDPPFKDELHFVHLNQKQDSAVAVKDFLSSLDEKEAEVHCHNIGVTTEAAIRFGRLTSFSSVLDNHEKLLSEILKTPTIKEQLFPDYPNTIKSLGAWGGDFVLAIGTSEEMDYFREKGYNTVIPYNDMVINNSHQ